MDKLEKLLKALKDYVKRRRVARKNTDTDGGEG